MRFICSFLLLVCCGSAVLAQGKTVTRFIEFRDGSILRLPIVEEPWKVTVVRGTGKIEEVSLLPSQIQMLSLAQDDDFHKKRQILSLVQQLGSESFRRREDAYQRLLKFGPDIRADLKACLELTEDVETHVRLNDLLNELPEAKRDDVTFRIAFDRLHVKAPKLTFSGWGFLGAQPIHVVVNGKKYALRRKDVARLTSGSVEKSSAVPNAVKAGFHRLSIDQFPKKCTEEGFENDPVTGRKLNVGENIEKLFVSKGFVLSTSIKSSYVSPNTFTVSGKSRGWSVATHEPIWNGVITIRFVQPGQEHIPAGVTYFGCYIAAVVPGGTELIAYDRYDNELGRIATQQHNTDFLGVSSLVPIHKIRIVPNPQKDKDYTLDDFIFVPASAVHSTHAEKFTVHLNDGDLILCKDVSLAQGKLHLKGLTAELPDLTFPLTELKRINMPQKDSPEQLAGMYAELKDGSIIFAPRGKDARKMPVFPRRPNLLKDRKGLVGVWATGYSRLPAALQGSGTSIWDADERKWQEISYVRFLEEVVLWKNEAGEFASSGYEKLPPLWLSEPKTKLEAGSWHVVTAEGEDLVLPGGSSISAHLSENLRAVWQGQPIMIPARDISAIYHVAGK